MGMVSIRVMVRVRARVMVMVMVKIMIRVMVVVRVGPGSLMGSRCLLEPLMRSRLLTFSRYIMGLVVMHLHHAYVMHSPYYGCDAVGGSPCGGVGLRLWLAT